MNFTEEELFSNSTGEPRVPYKLLAALLKRVCIVRQDFENAARYRDIEKNGLMIEVSEGKSAILPR